ncbi:MAG: Rrf2 family transcriptional regulator [Pseudoflavonifractor sp.]|nr:Rrf2 family transcriptional regulator [Pseudoflavonifractor sp.]MDY3018771.1 Rrf2 family transcriptional regulator [Oscillospiraceae bacterium]
MNGLLITRETDYALRILRALSDGELLTAKALTQKEAVPHQFAYKILKKLEGAGLIRITRGTGGGCRLTADLRQVSLYDLMGAVGEDTLLISCMMPDYQCTRPQENPRCAVHYRLCDIQKTVDRELQSHTVHWLLFGPKQD